MARRKRTTQTTSADQPPSGLLSLPAELRNSIYHYVFQDAIKLRDRRKHAKIRCLDAPGLLVTCKQIYHEAVGIYYASTKFMVWFSASRLSPDTDNNSTRLGEFLRGIGEDKRELIRHIYLDHLQFEHDGYGLHQSLLMLSYDRARARRVLSEASGEIEGELAAGVAKVNMGLPSIGFVFTSEPEEEEKKFRAILKATIKEK